MTTKNPEKYKGSGIKWLNHVNYHGKHHVETLWYCLFYDEEALTEFAEMCSKQWDIVGAIHENGDKMWANLKDETGKGDPNRTQTSRELMSNARAGKRGNATGHVHTAESKEKNRLAHLGKKDSQETIEKKRASSTGHQHTDAAKQQIRETLTDVKHDKERIEKMRAAKLGKKNGPYKQSICPHCGKVGAGGVMKRYHFDNCKQSANSV